MNRPAPARSSTRQWSRVLRRGIYSLVLGAFVPIGLAAALSWGRCVEFPRRWFNWETGSWTGKQLQPNVSIEGPLGRLAMQWDSSPVLDVVSLRRVTEKEWSEWGLAQYPDVVRVPELVRADLSVRESLRGEAAFQSRWTAFADKGKLLRSRAPSWASRPPGEGELVLIETAAYGWPLRVLKNHGRVFADPADTLAITRMDTDGLGTFKNPWVAHPAWGIAWIPIWPALLASSAAYGVMWFSLFCGGALWRSRRRRKQGRCTGCGYDLAGVPDSSPHLVRCPECDLRNVRLDHTR